GKKVPTCKPAFATSSGPGTRGAGWLAERDAGVGGRQTETGTLAPARPPGKRVQNHGSPPTGGFVESERGRRYHSPDTSPQGGEGVTEFLADG
ncbi:MAG: hypothetical protein ACKOFW_01550, partial [Planctomycetaceae bacterium]